LILRPILFRIINEVATNLGMAATAVNLHAVDLGGIIDISFVVFYKVN